MLVTAAPPLKTGDSSTEFLTNAANVFSSGGSLGAKDDDGAAEGAITRGPMAERHFGRAWRIGRASAAMAVSGAPETHRITNCCASPSGQQLYFGRLQTDASQELRAADAGSAASKPPAVAKPNRQPDR